MNKYHYQLKRITQKLPQARSADLSFQVFGSQKHRYVIGKTITVDQINSIEFQYSIEFPECYKSFLLYIGNGGLSIENSAAGPFYGIFPFGEGVFELVLNDSYAHLSLPCVLYPSISDKEWEYLNRDFNESDELNDPEFDRKIAELFGGLLPLGEQGCGCYHALVLNGQYKGRVVNLDTDRNLPRFAFEENFLDWYERWLDEVISGELANSKSGWFGYTRGGPEEELFMGFVSSTDASSKQEYLFGLLNKVQLSSETISKIGVLLEFDTGFNSTLIQLICKTNYEVAKPHLLRLADTDLFSVFRFVYEFAVERSAEWVEFIDLNKHRIDDSETFRYCNYLLIDSGLDVGDLLAFFTRHVNDGIRSQAFHALGKMKNKSDYIETFIRGLNDESKEVVILTLQALKGIKNKILVEHYQRIAKRFSEDEAIIYRNLNQRLQEYSLITRAALHASHSGKKNWFTRLFG